MQTRIHGNIVFECDSCTETLDTRTDNFKAARAVLGTQGWQSRLRGPVWFHYCSECEPNLRKEAEAQGQQHFRGV